MDLGIESKRAHLHKNIDRPGGIDIMEGREEMSTRRRHNGPLARTGEGEYSQW